MRIWLFDSWPCAIEYHYLEFRNDRNNFFNHNNSLSLLCRDSLAAQLEITLTKADSEQLARSIAEEQYSDLEKEKIMKELEIKEMMARHKQELAEKDATIGSVSSLMFPQEFLILDTNSFSMMI